MRSLWIIVGFIAIVAVIFVGIRLTQKPTPQEQVIKIGAVLPLTGPAASFGQTNRRGIEIAIKHLNEKGSRLKFKLVLEDGMSDPKSSVTAFKKLEQQGVKTVITSLSSVALALVPLADSGKILLFADVAHPKVTGSSPFVFRHSQTAEQEAKLILDWLKNNREAPSIAVLWVNDDYGRSFQRALEEYLRINSGAAKIASSISFEKTEVDFRNLVQKSLASSPQVIVICGYGKSIGVAIKRLRENRFSGEIISTMGFVISPDATLVAGDAAKGIWYIDFDIDKKDPQYIKLETEYFQTYNEIMPTFVAIEYNTTMLLAYAIEMVGYDPLKISNYLKSLGFFKSAGETMQITEKGDILPRLRIRRYQ